jgi:hypothetical protein
MDSLNAGRIAQTLQRLFKEAESADRALMESFIASDAPEQIISAVIEAEGRDLRGLYRSQADNFLSVSPEFGRFLYQCVRVRANLEAAGVADLVEIREGDARATLKDVSGNIDLVLLDGAFSLHLPVLKLLEPSLSTGALILAENAFEQAGGYLAYVRNPANGYVTQPIPLNEKRGNELTVRTS